MKIDDEKLRNEFKWMKGQWRRYTDRGKKGRDQSPLTEPEWYKILNPIFSDTHGNMELASQASDALYEKICGTSNIYENEQADGSHCSYQEDNGSDLPNTLRG